MKDWLIDVLVSANSKRILAAALGAGLVAWGEEMGMAQEQTLAISGMIIALILGDSYRSVSGKSSTTEVSNNGKA